MAQDLTSTQALLAAKRENMASRLQGLGGGGGLQGIRLAARHFVFPDDTKVRDNLEIVVLDWALSYNYYDKPYVKGERQFPACFAVGQAVPTMKPSNNSPSKQNSECATCPQNQFGSGVGNAKACQNRINLAVQVFEHGPESPLYRISISPTGIKNWRNFAAALDERNVLPVQVVTRLGFDDSVTYDRLTFAATKKTTDLDAFVANMERATQLLLVEPSPSAGDD